MIKDEDDSATGKQSYALPSGEGSTDRLKSLANRYKRLSGSGYKTILIVGHCWVVYLVDYGLGVTSLFSYRKTQSSVIFTQSSLATSEGRRGGK